MEFKDFLNKENLTSNDMEEDENSFATFLKNEQTTEVNDEPIDNSFNDFMNMENEKNNITSDDMGVEIEQPDSLGYLDTTTSGRALKGAYELARTPTYVAGEFVNDLLNGKSLDEASEQAKFNYNKFGAQNIRDALPDSFDTVQNPNHWYQPKFVTVDGKKQDTGQKTFHDYNDQETDFLVQEYLKEKYPDDHETQKQVYYQLRKNNLIKPGYTSVRKNKNKNDGTGDKTFPSAEEAVQERYKDDNDFNNWLVEKAYISPNAQTAERLKHGSKTAIDNSAYDWGDKPTHQTLGSGRTEIYRKPSDVLFGDDTTGTEQTNVQAVAATRTSEILKGNEFTDIAKNIRTLNVDNTTTKEIEPKLFGKVAEERKEIANWTKNDFYKADLKNMSTQDFIKRANSASAKDSGAYTEDILATYPQYQQAAQKLKGDIINIEGSTPYEKAKSLNNFMSSFNWNMVITGMTMMETSGQKELSGNLADALEMYDASDTNIVQIVRGLKNMVIDPTTYASFASMPFFKVIAKESTKQGLIASLRNFATKNTVKAGTIGAGEGAVYTGAFDAAKQKIGLEGKRQEDFDWNDFTTSVAMGGAIGGALGGTLGKLTSIKEPTRNGKVDFNVDINELTTYIDTLEKQLDELNVNTREHSSLKRQKNILRHSKKKIDNAKTEVLKQEATQEIVKEWASRGYLETSTKQAQGELPRDAYRAQKEQRGMIKKSKAYEKNPNNPIYTKPENMTVRELVEKTNALRMETMGATPKRKLEIDNELSSIKNFERSIEDGSAPDSIHYDDVKINKLEKESKELSSEIERAKGKIDKIIGVENLDDTIHEMNTLQYKQDKTPKEISRLEVLRDAQEIKRTNSEVGKLQEEQRRVRKIQQDKLNEVNKLKRKVSNKINELEYQSRPEKYPDSADEISSTNKQIMETDKLQKSEAEKVRQRVSLTSEEIKQGTIDSEDSIKKLMDNPSNRSLLPAVRNSPNGFTPKLKNEHELSIRREELESLVKRLLENDKNSDLIKHQKKLSQVNEELKLSFSKPNFRDAPIPKAVRELRDSYAKKIEPVELTSPKVVEEQMSKAEFGKLKKEKRDAYRESQGMRLPDNYRIGVRIPDDLVEATTKLFNETELSKINTVWKRKQFYNVVKSYKRNGNKLVGQAKKNLDALKKSIKDIADRKIKVNQANARKDKITNYPMISDAEIMRQKSIVKNSSNIKAKSILDKMNETKVAYNKINRSQPKTLEKVESLLKELDDMLIDRGFDARKGIDQAKAYRERQKNPGRTRRVTPKEKHEIKANEIIAEFYGFDKTDDILEVAKKVAADKELGNKGKSDQTYPLTIPTPTKINRPIFKQAVVAFENIVKLEKARLLNVHTTKDMQHTLTGLAGQHSKIVNLEKVKFKAFEQLSSEQQNKYIQKVLEDENLVKDNEDGTLTLIKDADNPEKIEEIFFSPNEDAIRKSEGLDPNPNKLMNVLKFIKEQAKETSTHWKMQDAERVEKIQSKIDRLSPENDVDKISKLEVKLEQAKKYEEFRDKHADMIENDNIAHKAYESILKGYKKAFKNIDNDKYIKHIIETDYQSINGWNEVDAKAFKDKYIDMYKLVEKEIKAGANAIAKPWNQVDDFINGGLSISRKYKLNDESADVIDKLISIEAMSDDAWKFIEQNKDTDAFEAVMNARRYQDKQSRILFNHNPTQRIKGYVDQEYGKLMTLDEDGKLVFNTEHNTEPGILQMSHEEKKTGRKLYKGTPLSNANVIVTNAIKEFYGDRPIRMSKVVDENGKIMKFRQIINGVKQSLDGLNVEDSLIANIVREQERATPTKNMKLSGIDDRKVAMENVRDELGLNNDLASILAGTSKSLELKTNARNTTTDILNDLETSKLYSGTQKEGMIEIPQYLQDGLPRSLRGEVKFVDEELMTPILGRKKPSVVNKNSPQFTQVSEKVWTNAVTRFKQNVVLNNPSSHVTAEAFNLALFAQEGLYKNPIKTVTTNAKTLIEMNQNSSWEKEYFKLKHQGKSKSPRAKQLLKNLENSRLRQFEMAGLATNRLEGVGNQGDLTGEMVEELSRKTIGKGSKTADKIINRLGANILGRQDSLAGKITTTSFSTIDTSGRYTMAEHFYAKFKKQYPHLSEHELIAKAAHKSNGLFSDMNKIAPLWIDFIDRYGAVPFAKWFASSVPNIIRSAKEHPINALIVSTFLYAKSLESEDANKRKKGAGSGHNLSGMSPVEGYLDFAEQSIYGGFEGIKDKIQGDGIMEYMERQFKTVYLPSWLRKTNDKVVREQEKEEKALTKKRINNNAKDMTQIVKDTLVSNRGNVYNIDGTILDTEGFSQKIIQRFLTGTGRKSEDKLREQAEAKRNKKDTSN